MAKVILSLGDDVSTDAIYPGRFMATVLPSETPQYAFANLPAFNAELRRGVEPGSVLVAGRNFGCGSSREQAASALQGHGVCVVAKSFARIFLQNAVNLGLRVVPCPEIDASDGDDLRISTTHVTNLTTERSFPVRSLPPSRQAIIDAGGLIPYARKRLKAGVPQEGRCGHGSTGQAVAGGDPPDRDRSRI